MKTKYWIIGLSLLLALSVGLSLWLFRPSQAAAVQVISQGKVLYTLPLSVDTQITVESVLGSNVITVKDGKVAITEADCPDQHCVNRGFCSGGAQIVCLPNRLVLAFTDSSLDAITG